MERMTTTLITGANKGLGYEAARRLIAAGHDVWVGRPRRGARPGRRRGARRALRRSSTSPTTRASPPRPRRRGGGTGSTCSSTTPASPAACMPVARRRRRRRRARARHQRLRHRARDAGVPAAARALRQPGDRQRVQRHGLARRHERSRSASSRRIVGLAYPPSKAAVNMLTTQYAKALPGMRVNAVDPGYTATDFNGHSGTRPSRRAPTRSCGWRSSTRRPDRHLRRPPRRGAVVSAR